MRKLCNEIMCGKITSFGRPEWVQFANSKWGYPMADFVFKINTKINVGEELAATPNVILSRNPEILLSPSETTCAIFVQLLRKKIISCAVLQKYIALSQVIDSVGSLMM